MVTNARVMGITPQARKTVNGLTMDDQTDLTSFLNKTPAAKTSTGPTASDTNKGVLKGVGINLDTVLTPKGKRKKSTQLQGIDPTQLTTELGG